MILLVEDNEVHRRMYCATFHALGFAFYAEVDERLAHETAVRMRPSLVVIDIILPFLDGRRIIADIRHDAEIYYLPIVAISAGADPYLPSSCLAAGADRFLPKPTQIRTLMQTIGELARP